MASNTVIGMDSPAWLQIGGQLRFFHDPAKTFNGVKGRTITELKQAGTLLRLLSSDGITVFSRTGKLIETGFIIDTSHAMEVVTGGGRTAAASAASFSGKVVKVSKDGPIELL